MKTVSPLLFAQLQSAVNSLCTCWLITTTTGLVQAFTDNQEDLVISGRVYSALMGYTPTAVSSSADMSVDNLEVEGLFNSGQIQPKDLRAGLYNEASIQIFLVNRLSPDDGKLILRTGNIGQITYELGKFRVELRGLLQSYTQQIVETCSMTCRASLGDSRCKVDVAQYTFADKVSAVTDNKVITGTSLTKGDGYFDYGQIRFTSGECAGYAMEVQSYVGGAINLLMPMSLPIAVGDTYELVAGCSREATVCVSRFNNIINFRGEPYVPDPSLITVPANL